MEETISILYNNCYGGFDISNEALEEYNKRKLLIDKNYTKLNYAFGINRHDPILNEIYREFGNKINVKYSSLKIIYMPKKYEKYYIINEYDGIENVTINYNQYILDNIKEILNSQKNSINKIEEIKNLINLNIY